jgi:indoleamine 2,3-dioxygenase
MKDLGRTIGEEFPLIDVSKINDPVLVTALFREYAFTASSYLLEPAHHHLLETGDYGIARPSLPSSLAIPLEHLGKKLGSFPFLDYAYAYSLNNWEMEDVSLGFSYDNVRPMRLFNGCSDEHGFIATHSAMVAHSHKLIKAQQAGVLAAADGDTYSLSKALRDHASGMEDIYDQFREMWRVCNPYSYLKFRTFIMGPLGNTEMFPEGITYEGVDPEPRYYRGETGAQDSIIPSADNFLELHYPKNKLTAYLEDLRDYRPKDHRAYLEWIQKAAAQAKIKDTALSSSRSALALLENLSMVAKFRGQHWSMTKMYILNHTKFPRATGGTPITTWLPNQLGATLEYMCSVYEVVEKLKNQGDHLTDEEEQSFYTIGAGLQKHIRKIKDEVNKLQHEEGFKDQDVEEFHKSQTYKAPAPKSRLTNA